MTRTSKDPGTDVAGKSVPATPPKAETPAPDETEEAPTERPDPTRYGDWEKNGRCIDF